MLELEHLVFEFLGQFLVNLADRRHHALLDAAVRAVDDLRRLLDAAHGQRDRAMQLLDLGIERALEDFDRLPRYRAQTRHAMQHRGVQFLGQCRQRCRGHLGIELQEQDRNCLRMFVGKDLADDLRIEPAKQAECGKVRFLRFGRDLAHQVLGLHLSHRAIEQLAYAVDAAMAGYAAAFGRARKTGDRVGNRLRFDFADPAHGAGQLAQFVGRELAQDTRGILFRQQHHHDRGLVGTAENRIEGRGHAEAPERASSASRRRKASTASSGFSRAMRCASSICPSSACLSMGGACS